MKNENGMKSSFVCLVCSVPTSLLTVLLRQRNVLCIGHNAAETQNQTSLTFKNALQQLELALGSVHVITNNYSHQIYWYFSIVTLMVSQKYSNTFTVLTINFMVFTILVVRKIYLKKVPIVFMVRNCSVMTWTDP